MPDTEKTETEPVADPAAEPTTPDPSWDEDRARRTITNQRESETAAKKAAKDAEKRASEAETKIAELERKDLDDNERLQAEAVEAGERNEKLQVQLSAVEQTLREKGLQADLASREFTLGDETVKIADSELATAALLREGLTFNDAGEVEDLELRVESLLKERPVLRAGDPAPQSKPSTDGKAGSSAGPAPNLTSDELDWARQHGTSPERYEAHKNVRTLADFEQAQKRLAEQHN